ncbi:MAG TPA: TldD/PmbA family protein [Chloroflexia bacterium]|nr:TldD/PmbA family protein [Chloroflexia bacterium]
MIEESILHAALDEARRQGAAYAEVRAETRRVETISARDTAVEQLTSDHDRGWGVRVAAGGGWGFAATAAATPAAIRATVAQAVAIARAGAARRHHPIDLASMPAAQGTYRTPVQEDPFAVPLAARIDLLLAALAALRAAHPRVNVADGAIQLWHTVKQFVTTSGADLRQEIVESRAEITAYAVDASGYSYHRSYDNMAQAGWEFIRGLRLVEEAGRVGREAGELVAAPWAPAGPTTAILGPTMVALLVHESCGHPIELDRVLGWEAAFAGTSFLLPVMLDHFRYGSEHVNITADAITPGGLGTFGWDDEGTPAQQTPIIRDGIFRGYLTSRETAPAIGQRSNGTGRATSWGRIPIVRMTNLSLDADPHGGTLADLIAGVDDGLYLETPSSWSLDDKRMNFHFSVELCRAIKGGQLGQLYKAASFQDRTPHFWGSVQAVGGPADWRLTGFPGCAKGEPLQSCHVAHGAAPIRVASLDVKRGG